MGDYLELVSSVSISEKNRLISCDKSLQLIGTGRSAFAFKVKSSNTVIKVFFPAFEYIADEEAGIYKLLHGIHYFPSVHEAGPNYLVMDYVGGDTLFQCLTNGRMITPDHIEEIDYALSLAADRGLNPSDIHLRNIFITASGEIRIIDVARFRQDKECRQWNDLKKAHQQFYSRRFFLKKIPAPLLNMAAFLYKKGFMPYYRL